MKFRNDAEARFWSDAFDTALRALSAAPALTIEVADQKVLAMRERLCDHDETDADGTIDAIRQLAHDLDAIAGRLAALESREDMGLVQVYSEKPLEMLVCAPQEFRWIVTRAEARRLGLAVSEVGIQTRRGE